MSRRLLRPHAEALRTSKFGWSMPYRNWRTGERRWAMTTKTRRVLRYYRRDYPVWVDELAIDRAIRSRRHTA